VSAIDSSLVEAYKNAVYRVQESGSQIEFFVDSISPELDNTLRVHSAATAAFVTACNPQSKVLNPEENQRRHKNLLNRLKAMQLSWLDGDGGDQAGHWAAEKSILILGISRKAATDLAIEYGQNALVWIQRGEPAELVLTR
jgi:hypothetical protein